MGNLSFEGIIADIILKGFLINEKHEWNVFYDWVSTAKTFNDLSDMIDDLLKNKTILATFECLVKLKKKFKFKYFGQHMLSIRKFPAIMPFQKDILGNRVEECVKNLCNI